MDIDKKVVITPNDYTDRMGVRNFNVTINDEGFPRGFVARVFFDTTDEEYKFVDFKNSEEIFLAYQAGWLHIAWSEYITYLTERLRMLLA